MDQRVLQELEAEIGEEIPGFRVAFKDESWLHKAISFLVSPFNPHYMEFATVLGKTVWFPNRVDYQGNVLGSFATLAHEYVHAYDSRRDRWWGLKYLFPQVLALPLFLAFSVAAGWNAWVLALPFLGYAIGCLADRFWIFCVILGTFVLTATLLSFHLVGLWAVLLCLGIVALAPWPAPYRAEAEFRAYAMSLAVLKWRNAYWVSGSTFASYFTGPDYYFMSRNPGKVHLRLNDIEKSIVDGDLQKQEPYLFVYQFMKDRGLVR